MAESLVNVSEGSGKKLHTWSRVVGANTVEDEFTIAGEYPLASYFVSPAASVSTATAGDDIAQIMAGAVLNVRIRRIRVGQSALITAANGILLTVARVTSAGTGGTAITPSKADNADAASGASAASGVPNATHGAIGAQFFARSLYAVQTVSAGGSIMPVWEWVQQPGMKPIIIPAGITNGIVIRNGLARAGATVDFEIEFVETSFL